jgi:hypothetical protein
MPDQTNPGINLPIEPQVWDEFRILFTETTSYKDGDEWNIIAESGTTSYSGASGVGHMWGKYGPGYRVKSYSRRALPSIGEAVIEAPFGIIDGKAVNCTVSDLTQWNPLTDYIETADLLNKHIRIQARRGVSASPFPSGSSRVEGGSSSGAEQDGGSVPVNNNPWTTVWIGVALWQIDEAPPAANNACGYRRWHCVDLLYAYARTWFLDTHGFAPTSGIVHSPCYGMPGFNTGKDSKARGNRTSILTDTWTVTELNIDAHVFPGSEYSQEWTDSQVIDFALTSKRKGTAGDSDPIFSVQDDTTALASMSNVWEFTDKTTAWDAITQICRRQRGRGVSALDWDSDTGANPTGTLVTKLRTFAQVKDDSIIARGADTAGTSIDVYLTGDHRAVDEMFSVSQRTEEKYDAVETRGERIQVAITVSYLDTSIENGWTDTLATDYASKTDTARHGPEYLPVYQRHNLTTEFGKILKAANGNAGQPPDYKSITSFAYEMDPTTGAIAGGTTTANSLLTLSVMEDLPFFEGYNYTTDPATTYDTITRTESARRKPMVMIKQTGYDRFYDWEGAFHLTLRPNGVLLQIAGDDTEAGSFRTFGDLTKASLESAENVTDLTMTLAVELPNRIRYLTGDADSSKRKVIYIKGQHLWLAHPGTIWALDTDDETSNGIAPKRIASLRYLRDDRTELQYAHTLAVQWYKSDHTSATWALRCNGTYGTFTHNPMAGGSSGLGLATQTYPQIGRLVKKLYCCGNLQSGNAYDLNTPITSIEYDGDEGITTWGTDWNELDMGAYNE